MRVTALERPTMPDPVRQLEHTHGHLTKLVAELGAGLRGDGPLTPEAWEELAGLAQVLREELLAHFADEEEAVFPFIRGAVADESPSVDGLEAAHDAICEVLAAMTRVAETEKSAAAMRSLHARFGSAYADHSVDESALFDRLGKRLGEGERGELARRLRVIRGGR